MKIDNVSFGAVTPIIATWKAHRNLQKILTLSDRNYMLKDVTELYKKNSDVLSSIEKEVLYKAATKGKKISFLITGDEYDKCANAYKSSDSEWMHNSSISHHINRRPVVLGDNSTNKMLNLIGRNKL